MDARERETYCAKFIGKNEAWALTEHRKSYPNGEFYVIRDGGSREMDAIYRPTRLVITVTNDIITRCNLC
jgi:hypothetical protein